MMDSDLARITTILSIALVTILGLLILNLFKVHSLKKEITKLKNKSIHHKKSQQLLTFLYRSIWFISPIFYT